MFDKIRRSAPVLVLGVGNTLLGDDGTGIELVTRLSEQSARWGNAVEFVDGGTQGIALLGYIAGRSAIVLLDAVEAEDEPGTLHVLQGDAVLALGSRSSNAHEGNAGELLRVARLLGDLSGRLVLIGIEPDRVATGIGISEPVQNSIPAALQAAVSTIDSLLSSLQLSPGEIDPPVSLSAGRPRSPCSWETPSPRISGNSNTRGPKFT